MRSVIYPGVDYAPAVMTRSAAWRLSNGTVAQQCAVRSTLLRHHCRRPRCRSAIHAMQQPAASSLGGVPPHNGGRKSPSPAPSGPPLARASSLAAPPTSSIDVGVSDVAYWDLLSHPDIDENISRAKSASDAAVLRRKGHLKEQDNLIEFMRAMHNTHTCEEVMQKMERWVKVRATLLM